MSLEVLQEPVAEPSSTASAVQGTPAALETAPAAFDFYQYSYPALAAHLEERFGLPAFRAHQLFEWVYRKKVTDVSAMTNISKELRTLLAGHFSFPEALVKERHISSDGTRKYLFQLANGDCVESVMIKQPRRMTLCVSSQVGCGMGCAFCRTAQMKLRRNLTTSEILQQVLGVIADAKNFGDMFDNIVFMGMGEPLHNFKSVTEALRILSEPRGLAIGGRKITVSSVGLVPAIKKFGALGMAVNLAVSLNATTDEVRSQIMPINDSFPIAVLLQTLREFPLKARKRITIEYVMLKGVNDSAEDLARLPALLHGIPVKINLIPYNANAGLGFEPPAREHVHMWQKNLTQKGLNATVRWSKGADIGAACGQLAVKTESKTRGHLAAVPA